MRKILLALAAIAMSTAAFAQMPIGSWRVHFSYSSVNQIAQTPNKVFAMSEGSLYSVDKLDQTIEFYSKLSGLNGTNIHYIKYDPSNSTLFIGYSNGLIDLMRDGEINNISDLYQKQLNSTKNINDICFFNNRAYVATDFGIIVVNIPRSEIEATYYIGNNAADVKVISLTIVDNTIYATSGTDIYYANMLTDNLVDFSYWRRQSLPANTNVTSLANFNGSLCASAGGKIYTLSNNSWQERFAQRNITSLSTTGDKLIGYTTDKLCVLDNDFNFTELPVFYGSPQVEYDSSSKQWWFAARSHGLACYSVNNNSYETFLPNGPAQNLSYRLKYDNSRIIAVPGARWADRAKKLAQIMIYENGVWTNTDYSELVAFAGQQVYDFMNVAVDPRDKNHFFATSYGCGLFEYQDLKPIKRYTPDNSSLSCAASPTAQNFYTRTDGAIFDKDNNLWVMSTGPNGPNINIMAPDGTWHTTDIVSGGQRVVYNTPQEILIDSKRPNYKWIANGRDVPGLGLLDDNGTPLDFSDDRTIFRTSLHDQLNNDISIDLVFSCTQDKEGDIWLGTLSGPLKISYNTDFMKSDLCERVMIQRTDGSELFDFLLSDERINAIAVDGANRKWMGTHNSGAFLLSADGKQTIHHFTTDNSPMPSNTVQSIIVDPQTGEVFIGTENGLVSFQSDATDGESEYKDVYAYPNPVRPDFGGTITIVGLKTDSKILISTIAGQLVYRTQSNGGMATWDGRDGYGRRVPTGVYVVNAIDSDNKEHELTKILIMNQ